MKVLVTGGAGFIGSHLVDRLIGMGIETHIMVSGFRSQKHPSTINFNAFTVLGDLRDYDSIVDATTGMDMVFHLGGVFSHYCDRYPEMAIDVNVKGTWNLKKACVRNGVKRLIFASSSFVYGDPAKDPVSEVDTKSPKDLLGITKLAGETILQAPHPDEIKYTILRPFNVYGPRQYTDDLYTSVVSTWIKHALQKKALEIHDTGSQSLDFIYIQDVVDAFILSMSRHAENQIFNVGSGIAISMNELAALVNRLSENQSMFYNKDHPMFLRHVRADISKIKLVLGWNPTTDIEQGLMNTVDFFRGVS